MKVNDCDNKDKAKQTNPTEAHSDRKMQIKTAKGRQKRKKADKVTERKSNIIKDELRETKTKIDTVNPLYPTPHDCVSNI
jgi:hypothetical protein